MGNFLTPFLLGVIVGGGLVFFLFSKGFGRLGQKDPNLFPTIVRDLQS